MYLVVTSSKGISSVVMSRLLGTTQATAWRLGHAIREMSHDRYGPPLSGLVEVDLKYLGGAPKRRKDGKKSKRGKGTSKPRILIAVQRDDRMRATDVPTEKAKDIAAALVGVVAGPIQVFSDHDRTFINGMKAFRVGHKTVVHHNKEYVRDEVHIRPSATDLPSSGDIWTSARAISRGLFKPATSALRDERRAGPANVGFRDRRRPKGTSALGQRETI